MSSAEVTITTTHSSVVWAFGFILKQMLLTYKFIKIQKLFLQGNKLSLATNCLLTHNNIKVSLTFFV